MDLSKLFDNPVGAALVSILIAAGVGVVWRFIVRGNEVVIDRLMHTELLRKHPDIAGIVAKLNDWTMLLVAKAAETVVADAKASGGWNPDFAKKVKADVIDKVLELADGKVDELIELLNKELKDMGLSEQLVDKHMADQVEHALESLKEAIKAGATPAAAVAAAKANVVAASLPTPGSVLVPAPAPAPMTDAEIKRIADEANAAVAGAPEAGAVDSNLALLLMVVMLFVGATFAGCATTTTSPGCNPQGNLICCDPATINKLTHYAKLGRPDAGPDAGP